jgi:uncharacterized protein (DUF2141 family)
MRPLFVASTGRKILFAGLLSVFFFSAGAKAGEFRLQVKLKEVREAPGVLRVSLYREAESFRKEDRALKVISVPAVKGETTLVFEGLDPGSYAIMAYHDENSDGKLNLRFGMFPTEGYGLSNNPKIIGPPKFADSAFEVSEPETTTEIILSY